MILVALPSAAFLESLQALQGDYPVGRLSFIQKLQAVSIGLLYGADRLRLTLGLSDFGFLHSVGAQNRRFLMASATRISLLLAPSASRILARRSRSAFICFSMAS